jgi:hypothetical protein
LTEKSEALDLVAERIADLKSAKRTLEADLREKMRQGLLDMEVKVNLAVRAAVDAGNTFAAVGRALGTKDYATVKRRYSATTELPQAKGSYKFTLANLHDEFAFILDVEGHTTGVDAVQFADTNEVELFAVENLYFDEALTEKNKAVEAIEAKGEIYRKALEWLAQQ